MQSSLVKALVKVWVLIYFFIGLSTTTYAANIEYADAICRGSDSAECISCVNGGKIYTAFGCMGGSAEEFTASILKFAVGIAGGVSFLMLIVGAFLFITSAGDPKALENAKGTISSALTGLIFIIFSVVLLNTIGFQILNLPGF